jgi:hypothetical protein
MPKSMNKQGRGNICFQELTFDDLEPVDVVGIALVGLSYYGPGPEKLLEEGQVSVVEKGIRPPLDVVPKGREFGVRATGGAPSQDPLHRL